MRVLSVLLMLATTACSTDVRLTYSPTVNTFRSGPAVISKIDVIDRRSQPTNRLGTVRNEFGTVLKSLETAHPVSDEVAALFAQALEARGLRQNAGRGPFQLRIAIVTLDIDIIVDSASGVNLLMTLLDGQGRAVYEDRASTSDSGKNFFGTGIFANTDALRDRIQTVLNRAINDLLDKPAFHTALAASPAS